MKITYDEYVATWQAPEAKESLDARIIIDSKKRYEQRLRGASENPESTRQLENMTPEEYRSLRSYQMVQLLEGYKQSMSGKSHNLLSISPSTTDLNQIRRVIGQKAGYVYNNGPLALDNETVWAINHISTLIGSGYEYSSNDRSWVDQLSRANLEKIVDEMIAVKGILVEGAQLSYQDAVGDKVYRETSIAKRAIGKVQTPSRYISIPNGTSIELDSESLPKVGKNCFEIDDYELNWRELVNRKSNVFLESKKKLFAFFDKRIHSDAERNNPQRLGNKELEIDIGGEK